MIRFFVRLIALLILAGAFVALVLDGTRSIAAGAFTFTDVGSTAAALFPQKFATLQPLVERSLRPFVWDPVLVTFFALPLCLVLAAVGALLLRVTRRASVKIGYTSRP
jgi:hypothetical protein